MGQCPACRAWNTFVEERTSSGKTSSSKSARLDLETAVTGINDVKADKMHRRSTGFPEFDRVLGGGLVDGSLILLGGDPGIGKSTLLLQSMRNLSNSGEKVLYVSGEESPSQIKIRADRIGAFTGQMKLFCETDLELVSEAIRKVSPSIAVIDSIQTIYDPKISSAAGSVSQIREATSVFMRMAKTLGITIILVGHVTKEGMVAGPRVLEHMVDTVLYLEGERHASYRILRGVKNRFGSTDEIGIFEMEENGLTEVKNASEYMLNGRLEDASGSCISCSMGGSRPILLEIQALVCKTSFGMPRRSSTGTDANRINLLIAVLEKRMGLRMADMDAYVNIAGGIKVTEPAIDLGLLLAILSSAKDVVIDPYTVCFGEVGLSGEIRGVSQASRRVNEAKGLGFKKAIIPYGNVSSVKDVGDMEIVPVKTVLELGRAI